MNVIQNIAFRRKAKKSDKDDMIELLNSSGFFYDFEVDVAVELLLDSLEFGEESAYKFIFADLDEKMIGYICYGEIPCTVKNYDLYWLAIHNDHRGNGLGKTLMAKAEKIIKEKGGRKAYIETSGRPLYAPTRKFHQKCGFEIEAVLKDYYDEGDDKIILVKEIN